MQWWFSVSNHEVKIVPLVKFDHTGQCILIERWEEDQPPRAGATTTRNATAAMVPMLRQRITIVREVSSNPVSYHVNMGALVLSFRLLFLRNPGPQEGDIVISIPELEEFAADVWDVVQDEVINNLKV